MNNRDLQFRIGEVYDLDTGIGPAYELKKLDQAAAAMPGGLILKITVVISDAKVSKSADDEIITYSLGSCIGVSCYDPAAKIGGMLHFQLPNSRGHEDKAKRNPLMFADTGMKALLGQLATLGANRKNLQVKIAGGAQVMNQNDSFQIGKRNYAAIRQILWKNGMFISSEDVGGSYARNLMLRLSDGYVEVRSKGNVRVLK